MYVVYIRITGVLHPDSESHLASSSSPLQSSKVVPHTLVCLIRALVVCSESLLLRRVVFFVGTGSTTLDHTRPHWTTLDHTRPHQTPDTRPQTPDPRPQTRPDQTRPDQTRPDQTRPDHTRHKSESPHTPQSRPDPTPPHHTAPRNDAQRVRGSRPWLGHPTR